jgi:hypothetical protein
VYVSGLGMVRLGPIAMTKSPKNFLIGGALSGSGYEVSF